MWFLWWWSTWTISSVFIVATTRWLSCTTASSGVPWQRWKLVHRPSSRARNYISYVTKKGDILWRSPWPSSFRLWTLVRFNVGDFNNHQPWHLQSKRSWEVWVVVCSGQQLKQGLRLLQQCLWHHMAVKQLSMTWSRSTARSTSSRPPHRMASWSRTWPWTRALSWLDTQTQAGQTRRSQDHKLAWSLAWRIRRPWTSLQSSQCWIGNPQGLRGCVGQHSLQKLLQEMRQQIGVLLQTFSCQSSSTWNQLIRWAINWLGFKPQMPSRSMMQCWAKIQTWATRGRWCLIRAIQEVTSPDQMRWLPTRFQFADGLTKIDEKLMISFSKWMQNPMCILTEHPSNAALELEYFGKTFATSKDTQGSKQSTKKASVKITCKPFDMSEDHWLFGDRVHGSKGPLS